VGILGGNYLRNFGFYEYLKMIIIIEVAIYIVVIF